jgi:flagellar FliL protein
MASGSEGTKHLNDSKPKKKKRGKLLIPVLVLLVAAAGAAVAYNHFNPGALSGGRVEAEETTPKLKFLDFGSTVVNLADHPGNRFFRVALVLEFLDDGLVEKEIAEKEHRIRDGLVFLLRQKTTADLRVPEAPNRLREEIREEINRHLEQGEVVNVYFTEFIIQ